MHVAFYRNLINHLESCITLEIDKLDFTLFKSIL